VTAARDFVRAALRGRPGELVEAAELMTSELATNCVRHACTDFELTVSSGHEVRVELRDSGGGTPRPRSPKPRELAGRGLRIVEAMSDSWGVVRGAESKVVWFTLSAEGARAELGKGAGASATARSDGRGLVRALGSVRGLTRLGDAAAAHS
jgi:anti-sigma regulatory factor (Ser/Thr protein kinase)